MPIAITLRELIEAGTHFGSATARWNPLMKPYIHSKQSKIHIIDLRETIKGVIRATRFLEQISAQGKRVLFVGTKRQAADIMRQEGQRSESFFVANRWLGGTLTNMNTMRNRINRLNELESLETTGRMHEFSKKMISSLTRERKKIFRNFEGIRNMHELPGAVVVVDPGNEHICVAETVKLGIPLIGLVDTDDNPEKLDFVIPANDDAYRSIHLLVSRLADAVVEGRKKAATQGAMQQRAQGGSGAARGESRADRSAAAAAPEAAKAADAGAGTAEEFGKMGGFSMGGE